VGVQAGPGVGTERPRGDIRLALCRSCGFIANVAFDPNRLDYGRYENSELVAVVSAYNRDLADG
jgi:hypothetical protein